MKKSIRDLLALQETDLRIRSLELKYKTIPGERANLVGEFETVRKALANASSAVQEIEKKIRACQLETAGERENLKSCKIRTASIRKPAEYEAAMMQIAGCEKRISDLETQEISLYDDLETAQENLRKAERSYKATGRLVQGEVRALDALKEKILQEIREKSAESKLLEKNVAQTTLSQYKRMLASGKGEPLSPIRNGLCGNCSLSLPPMTVNEAFKGGIVICDNCSYLLYDPDARD